MLASVSVIPVLRNDVMLFIMWPNDIVLKCCHHSSYHILPVCDVTSSFAVFQATTLVKINFHDKIVIKNQKGGGNMEIKEIFT